jgi:transposase
MDHFAGLDVSVKETSVCIVDDMGRICAGSEGGERA